MKIPLLKLLLMATLYSAIGLITQTIALSVVLAVDLSAQQVKSVKEVRIEIEFHDDMLRDVFRALEKKTDFVFVFDKSDPFLKEKVTLERQEMTVEQVLLEISKQTRLGFRQVNNSISVKHGTFNHSQEIEIVIQGTTVTGRVTSADDGEGLPGVNVIVKGTSYGTVTDVEGNYTLEVPDTDAILVFSSVGYTTEEIVVGTQTVISLEMVPDVTALEEIVVVGYGEQTKKTMTGAIEALPGEKIVKSASVPDLSASIAGRIPGMTVQVRNGELGAEGVQMLIRGQSTLNNASPLILVDNVERPMNQVDPYDVESISVLKDASATAIFGVRGANGVILITTKRGKTGKAQITANVNQSWQSVTRRPQPLGAIEFMTLRNQVIEQNNQLLGINDPLPFGPEVFEAYQNNTFPEVYFDTDYAEEYLKDFVPLTRASVNIRGGNDKVKYFTSIGYLNQGGPFNTDGNTGAYDYDNDQRLDRLTYRANFDIQVNNTLKAWMNLSGFLQDKNDPIINGFSSNNTFDSNYFTMMALFTDAPAIAFGTGEYAYENNDVVGVIDAIRTPYGNLNRTGYTTRTTNTFQTSIGLEQDLGILTPGLSARALVSYDGTFNSSRGFRAYYNIVVPVIDDSGTEPVVKYLQGSNNEQDLVASLSQNSFWTSDIQLSLNYKRDFGPHATTGQFMYLQSQRTVGAQVPFNYVGLIGRATYGFDNRYLAEVNFGMNGSEQFAKGKRFGFFPSFSLGWVMSDEAFMENQRIVDFLKIRGSYGQVGNDRLGGDRFLYLGSYQQNDGGSDPSNFFTTIPGLQGFPDPVYEQVLANENVTWEVANKTNIGFEANFIGGFSLDIDLFYEKRSNILINNTGTPGVLFGPVPLPPVNAGVMENRGFEATLGWSKMWSNGLRVNTSVVASFARNKVLDAKEIPLDENFAYPIRTEGYSRGVLFGYESLGYFTSQEEIDGWANQDFLGSRSAPGDLKYQDLNGDGFINEQDQRPMEFNRVPELNVSYNLAVDFKGFDFSLLFHYVTNQAWNPLAASGRGVLDWGGQTYGGNRNYFEHHLKAWTPERAEIGEEILYPRMDPAGSTGSRVFSTYWYTNLWYLRLRNIEIGYTLPKIASATTGIQNIRVFVNGQNLLLWDNMRYEVIDPEMDGILSHPIFSTLNLGLNMTF